jgi:hypothetical protein
MIKKTSALTYENLCRFCGICVHAQNCKEFLHFLSLTLCTTQLCSELTCQFLQLPGITIAQFSNTRALMKAVADDIIGEFVKNLEKLQCPVSFIKDIYRLSSS